MYLEPKIKKQIKTMNEERARILNNNDFALLTVVVVFNNVKTSPFL